MTTTNDPNNLDADELVQFAMRAIESDDEQAIGYLRRAIEAAPSDGKPWSPLAGVHAGPGLQDRAADDLVDAPEPSPDLHRARFDLGYLQLLKDDPEAAELAWRALDVLQADEPLRLCALQRRPPIVPAIRPPARAASRCPGRGG